MLLAQNSTNINLGAQAIKQGLPFAQNLASSDGGFGLLLGNILSGILVVAALMTLLYLIWGGIEWISSGGDKGKTESARNKITQAIIGLIVLAATVAIFGILQSFLGVTILNFGGGSAAGGGSSSTSSSTTGGTTGSNGGSGSNTSNASTCAGGVPIGKIVSDGGAGGYCTNGAAAQVVCNPAGKNLPYTHFDPVSCPAGSAPAYTWTTN